jgi:hypothetical protein
MLWNSNLEQILDTFTDTCNINPDPEFCPNCGLSSKEKWQHNFWYHDRPESFLIPYKIFWLCLVKRTMHSLLFYWKRSESPRGLLDHTEYVQFCLLSVEPGCIHSEEPFPWLWLCPSREESVTSWSVWLSTLRSEDGNRQRWSWLLMATLIFWLSMM